MKIPNNRDVIDYLETSAIVKLSNNFGVSRNNGLDILSRSLLFKDYNHLVKFMNALEYDNGIYEFLEEDNDLFDLRNGIFFSEFILMRELQIELLDAHKFKTEIDYMFFGKSPPTEGDIYFADLNLVNEQSQLIKIGRQHRIMFGYPIKFYCRKYNRKFHTKSGGFFEDESLWCDGISVLYPIYFDGDQNLRAYIWYIVNGILKYNNLILEEPVYNGLKRSFPSLLQFVKDSFRTLPIYEESYANKNHLKGLFLPSLKSEFEINLQSKSSNPFPINPKPWTISSKLKYLLDNSGLTQVQLAERSGICEKTIRNTLKSKHYPNVHTIKLLASAFNMTLGEFLQDIDE